MLRRLGFLAAFALAACSGAWAQEPVRIGFSLAKTGLFATATPAQLNAYHFWRDQVNAKGGLDVAGTRRKVEFVEYDDQSSTANTVKIYEKLITDDKVDLLLSPWGTPSHFAVVPVLEKFGFPMVGNTASSVLVRELNARQLLPAADKPPPDPCSVECRHVQTFRRSPGALRK